jgi:hypothetical protein
MIQPDCPPLLPAQRPSDPVEPPITNPVLSRQRRSSHSHSPGHRGLFSISLPSLLRAFQSSRIKSKFLVKALEVLPATHPNCKLHPSALSHLNWGWGCKYPIYISVHTSPLFTRHSTIYLSQTAQAKLDSGICPLPPAASLQFQRVGFSHLWSPRLTWGLAGIQSIPA